MSAAACCPDLHETTEDYNHSHEETFTKTQHRPTHTGAQRGVALTLAHTDPLAQPRLQRNHWS